MCLMKKEQGGTIPTGPQEMATQAHQASHRHYLRFTQTAFSTQTIKHISPPPRYKLLRVCVITKMHTLTHAHTQTYIYIIIYIGDSVVVIYLFDVDLLVFWSSFCDIVLCHFGRADYFTLLVFSQQQQSSRVCFGCDSDILGPDL